MIKLIDDQARFSSRARALGKWASFFEPAKIVD